MDFVKNIHDIDIGKLIKEKFDEAGMTKEEFADKINKERSTVYDIFSRSSIDIVLLINISKVLNYDFIRNVYYGEQISPIIYIAVKTSEDEIKKIDLPKEFIRFIKPSK